jgi:hypothetical protein
LFSRNFQQSKALLEEDLERERRNSSFLKEKIKELESLLNRSDSSLQKKNTTNEFKNMDLTGVT